MAENLNYDLSGSECYNNNTTNCTKYGRLYNWATAKTACPNGWRLPGATDWNVLMKFINPLCSDNKDCADAGTKLKATSGWNNSSENIYIAGTDDYGFSALPGGFLSTNGKFFYVGECGYWWSSAEYSNTNDAHGGHMCYNMSSALWGRVDRSYLFSVRCLQN